jgi:hypothetical protein
LVADAKTDFPKLIFHVTFNLNVWHSESVNPVGLFCRFGLSVTKIICRCTGASYALRVAESATGSCVSSNVKATSVFGLVTPSMTTMLTLELPESTTRRRIRDAINEQVRTITVQSYLYLGSDWREKATAMTSLRFGDLFIITALPVTGTVVGSRSRHTFCIIFLLLAAVVRKGHLSYSA